MRHNNSRSMRKQSQYPFPRLNVKSNRDDGKITHSRNVDGSPQHIQKTTNNNNKIIKDPPLSQIFILKINVIAIRSIQGITIKKVIKH